MQNLIFNPFTLVLILALATVSFLFSASETSIIGLSRIRLRHMLARGIRRAQHVQRLIQKLDKFIIAILIGNNVVNIAISAIVTAASVIVFGYKWGVLIATLLTSFFIVLICEITPKILAVKHTERIALFVAPIMEAFTKLLSPLIAIFNGLSSLIIKLFRLPSAKRSPLITEEELRLMIEIGKEEGFVSDKESKMLQRIFEFGDLKVKDVMVPKDRIVGVSINTTSEQLLDIFVEKGHARLPVYKSSVENIVGIVYAQDLLYILRDKGLFLLQDLVHEAYYIQPSMSVSELLTKFQSDRIQIVIVADEHKKTLGLVTLEDLTEEIVGEVEEHHIRRHSKSRIN